MSAESYEILSEKIFTHFGGKENLAKESQQVIREAVELGVNSFLEERLMYPKDDAEVASLIILGKTMTFIKFLSLKKDIPIIGYKEIPVSLDSAKKIDPKGIKIALIQIGLSEAAYTRHDTKLGLLFQLKDPSEVSKIILETLREKISDDVVFVCLPELSVPSDATFIDELEHFAIERKMIIVAGSFHDLIQSSNVSLVITPDRERFAQHKMRGANEYGEGLKPEIFCVVKIFDAVLARFTVLICSDVMLDSVSSLLTYKSMKCQGVDIIFNPSHTGAIEKIHGGLRALCNRTLSYVAFANSEHGGSVVFVPRKISEEHPLMCGKPCDPCKDYEVKVTEYLIDVENLRKFRYAHYNITKPEDCFVSPT
jgi:hypothetical protein